MAIESKIKVVLVIGEGHSGSTLLDTIIDAHPAVTGVGEIYALGSLIKKGDHCACGRLTADCELWSTIIKQIDLTQLPTVWQRARQFFLGSDRYYYRDSTDKQVKLVDQQAYVDETEKLYRAILAATNSQVIFDTSKEPDRAELLIKSQRFDVTVIHLVRDGRGVMYSNVKRGRSAWRFMKKWLSSNIRSEIVKMRNSVPSFTLHYDRLVTNPQAVINNLIRALDLPSETDLLQTYQQVSHHQVAGNTVVKKTSHQVSITKDEAWRTALSGTHRLLFMLGAGWLNLYYTWVRTDDL